MSDPNEAAAAPAAPETPAEAQAPAPPERAALTPQAGSSRAGLDFVLDVPLRVTVEIGSARMQVGEVLQLDKGSVIELDRMAGEPADVLVNGRRVARGEVTLVEDKLAVRILELDRASHPERGESTGA